MKILTAGSLVLMCWASTTLALAKLPPPSDEAKAKAAEAAAKAAHGNKVADFQLCKAMDRTAAAYYANAKKAGMATKAATGTTPCAEPGAFVYTPPVAAAPAVAAATVATVVVPTVAPTVATAAPAAPKK